MPKVSWQVKMAEQEIELQSMGSQRPCFSQHSALPMGPEDDYVRLAGTGRGLLTVGDGPVWWCGISLALKSGSVLTSRGILSKLLKNFYKPL